MSYENNRIKYYLDRNSLIQTYSKTTSSIYYYFRSFSVRYSDHITLSKLRTKQYQIIRTSKKVLIQKPEEDKYVNYNEKTGLYFLRKLVKEDIPRKDFRDVKYIKFMKNKNRNKEKRIIKKYLSDIIGKDLKTLSIEDINQTCIGIR